MNIWLPKNHFDGLEEGDEIAIFHKFIKVKSDEEIVEIKLYRNGRILETSKVKRKHQGWIISLLSQFLLFVCEMLQNLLIKIQPDPATKKIEQPRKVQYRAPENDKSDRIKKTVTKVKPASNDDPPPPINWAFVYKKYLEEIK